MSDSDELVETEPNDSRDKATRVPLGANLNGRFDKAGDIDHFVVAAKKGQKFTFTGITRRVGSPAAVYLRLLNSAGAKVAEVLDLGITDSVIKYTFPPDGDYYVPLQARDRRGRGRRRRRRARRYRRGGWRRQGGRPAGRFCRGRRRAAFQWGDIGNHRLP